MLCEIGVDDYSKVRPLFDRLPRTTVAGTLAGLTPGHVYVDDQHNPKGAFTWSEFRFSYLVGDPGDDEFVQELAALLEGELLPAARGSHDPTVALYPDSPAWLDVLDGRLAAYHPKRLFRSLHRFDRQAFEHRAVFLEPLPPGFKLLPIDGELCGRFPELAFAYELLWGSVRNFLAHGFGFCILSDNELASACDSAFCAGDRVEIGVETKAVYRRLGLARQVTTAFILESLRRGLEPVWECWWENEASRSLATRLGFEWLEDYPVLFIELEGS
jgi:RimJ/RimL family protein N-acetyltransferase